RAAYNIHNFTLQFLELELPPGSQVWSVHVSGQPVRPAKIRKQGRSDTLLPLQKTSVGDFSSKVVVIYSGHLGEPLHRWTQVRPPAPKILSNVPVSRTLWTVLLPREYNVSLVESESNLIEVAAAYQQEERKLSFLDELRQLVQVASIKGKSASQKKARYNLKQIDEALHGYAHQSAQVDAKNAADVQEQAQQIQAEIRRLEELKTDTKRTDGETTFYFTQPRQEPDAVRIGVDLERGFEKLLEPDMTDSDKAAPSAAAKKPRDQVRGRPEQRRGDLRKQATEQLEKLQMPERREPIQSGKADPQKPSELPKGKQATAADGLWPAGGKGAGEQSPRDGQAAPGAPVDAAGAGQLSLDLDVAPVGTRYHFRKLHGKPRLVLRARHEYLSRGLSAIIWAGLCLTLATAAIQGLRRPDVLARAYRCWPWLAAIAGTAWLFLLPAGVFGLALLATALCVLIARTRKRRTTNTVER
ncbi:MAG: hypothetical protein K8R46_01920, partial [Pirellulales bacterium]|nr:hypothetical protein [Pirellulales bacterium]